MIVIGGTHTGKTSLLRLGLLRGEFGSRPSLEVVVMSPAKMSLEQPIWKDLERRGFNILRILCNGTVPDAPFDPDPPSAGRRRLIIIDDVDLMSVFKVPIKGGGFQRGKPFLTNLFAVDSHHANMGCILVSHQIKIGAPCLCENADYILLTTLAPAQFTAVKKTLELSQSEVAQIKLEHAAPEGIVAAQPTGRYELPSPDTHRCYNHVVILKQQLVGKDGTPMPRIWKFGTHASSPVGLIRCMGAE